MTFGDDWELRCDDEGRPFLCPPGQECGLVDPASVPSGEGTHGHGWYVELAAWLAAHVDEVSPERDAAAAALALWFLQERDVSK